MREEKYFMASDVNNGIVLCRRLGYDPVSIEVGTLDNRDVWHWNYPLDNCPPIKLKKKLPKGTIVFLCKKWKWEKPTVST